MSLQATPSSFSPVLHLQPKQTAERPKVQLLIGSNKFIVKSRRRPPGSAQFLRLLHRAHFVSVKCRLNRRREEIQYQAKFGTMSDDAREKLTKA
jgi:hypothetical protein